MKKTVWLLIGTSLIALAMWSAYLLGGSSLPPVPPPAPSSSAQAPAPAAQKPAPRVLQVSAPTPLSPAEQEAAQDEGVIISDLFDAAIEGTPDQVESVYAALSHPNDAVREAAVDVIIQHMGRESIPRLRAALATAVSAEEKIRLTEAIEFIELPTLSEVRGSAPRPPRGQATGQKPARPGGPDLLRKKTPPAPQD